MNFDIHVSYSGVRQVRLRACAVLGLTLLACGSTPRSQEEPQSVTLAAEPGPWSASSTRIDIRSFGFWEGGWRFDADRATLSAEQLRLLDGLRAITPVRGCPQDMPEQSVTIADLGGGSREYRLNATNTACDGTGENLEWASAEPFLQTLKCLGAGATRGTTTPADAPTIVPNDGCSHGLFGASTGNTIWIRLKVTAAGRRHRIETLDCDEADVTLALYDRSGTWELARGGPATLGACASVEHTFATAGDYLVRIDKKESPRAGDFFLRFTSLAM